MTPELKTSYISRISKIGEDKLTALVIATHTQAQTEEADIEFTKFILDAITADRYKEAQARKLFPLLAGHLNRQDITNITQGLNAFQLAGASIIRDCFAKVYPGIELTQ